MRNFITVQRILQQCLESVWEREKMPMAKTISFVKGKGSLRHNNRAYIANNVYEERTSWNITYIQQSLTDTYEQLFGSAIAEYNAKQKRKDRKIDNYLTRIVLCLDNDDAGQKACDKFQKLLTERELTVTRLVPTLKDFNEDLVEQQKALVQEIGLKMA